MRPKRRSAVLIVGHGSRAAGFAAAMKRVARTIAKRRPAEEVTCAYLEIAPPSLGDAVGRLAARGFAEIRVLPYFLQAGRHVREDLPALVREAAKKHPAVRLVLCPYLGYDERLAAVAEKRLRERN